jgi:hypothetical protein
MDGIRPVQRLACRRLKTLMYKLILATTIAIGVSFGVSVTSVINQYPTLTATTLNNTTFLGQTISANKLTTNLIKGSSVGAGDYVAEKTLTVSAGDAKSSNGYGADLVLKAGDDIAGNSGRGGNIRLYNGGLQSGDYGITYFEPVSFVRINTDNAVNDSSTTLVIQGQSGQKALSVYGSQQNYGTITANALTDGTATMKNGTVSCSTLQVNGVDTATTFTDGTLTVANGGINNAGTISASYFISNGADTYKSGFRLSDPALNHGMVNVVRGDVFGFLQRDSGVSNQGGLDIVGLSNIASVTGLTIGGIVGSLNTTVPALVLYGRKQNGVGTQAVASNEQVMVLKNYTSTLETVMGNGNHGIGTTAPAALLDVNGTVSCSAVQVNGAITQTGLLTNTNTGVNNFYGTVSANQIGESWTSFTPTFNSAVTWDTTSCTYKRVGKEVYLRISCYATHTGGTNGTTVLMGNPPYPISNTDYCGGGPVYQNGAQSGITWEAIRSNANTFELDKTAFVGLLGSDVNVAANRGIIGQFSYTTP